MSPEKFRAYITVMCKILLKPEEFNKLLQSQEYAPYLLFKPNVKGIVWLNIDNMPKTHYLPICGNYYEGIKLVWKINDLLEKGCNSIEFHITTRST